ncbi:MAG: serine hydrolase domain-containing protein [Bacteroidota bacterium]
MMRRLLLLCLLVGAAPALAQPAHLVATLDSLRAIAEAADLPGLAITASIDGETVWAEGFGMAVLNAQEPVTPQTRFRVGSVSKSMTAVAVAQLVEAGRLDVDAPVQAYVPAFPEKRWPVTTRQLGAHLGGIRHYLGDEAVRNVRYPTVASGLAIFSADSLLHEPGTQYHYTSYGYNLISAVVEGASDQTFLAYMAAHVFGPLGMTRTVADWTDSTYSGTAAPYVQWGREFIPAPPVDNSYKWAGGGFLSTVEDMRCLGEQVVLGDALGERGRALLFTEQTTRDGEGVGYGVGWRLGDDRDGRPSVFHSGGSMGGSALLYVLPKAGVVLAAASNVSRADLGWVAGAASALAAAHEAAVVSPRR